MFVRSLLLAFSLVGTTAAVAASDAAYKVSMNITRDGEALASPTVIVRGGVPASARLDGEETLEIRLVVYGENPARLEATVLADDGESPTLVALVGKRAFLSSGSLSVEFLAEPYEQ